MWSRHVLLKYWAMQAASWVVVFAAAWLAARLFGWPTDVVWVVLAVWVAKDIVLYPWVWRSYDERDAPATAYPGEGTEGVALVRLEPRGAVRVRGERWNARVAADGEAREAAIDGGARVRVVGREGMTLLVVRARTKGALEKAKANEQLRR